MKKTYKITPVELFFLGKVMNAKYMDYEYIQMAPDFQKHYALTEKETMTSLNKKGFLFEDFTGNIEVDSPIEQTFGPIFFGEFESEISLKNYGFAEETIHCKFHFHGKNVTQVIVLDDELLVCSEENDALDELKNDLIPVSYAGKQDELMKQESYNAERFMILKNTLIGVKSCTRQFIQICENWYAAKDENTIKGLTQGEMLRWWEELMKGRV